MQLTQISLNNGGALERQAKALYELSFPKQERVPWWLLRLNARRAGFDLTAWTDGDRFCGFTASTTVDGMYFLMFLAVEPSLQGIGCGSAILSAISRERDRIVLNMEPMDPSAPNYPQRQRRFAFYQRNGFFDTGCDVWEVGGKFRILSTQPQLDMAAYKKVFKWLSFGLWNVKLRKEQE